MYEPTEMIVVNAATGEETRVWRTTPKFSPAEESDAELMSEALKPKQPAAQADRERAAQAAIHPAKWWAERQRQASGG
jgi:hypothetical protein